MVEDFAFSEVVRKLANLIRLGKISEIDGSQVKVQIGRVITGWLPIISTAGESSAWTPISKGEQVAVFAPYGEFAQAFVLRSIHYNDFKAPENTKENSFKTKYPIKINGEKGFDSEFTQDFSVKVGSAEIKLSKDSISIKNGNSSVSLSNNGIILNAGGGSLTVGNSISINGNSLSLSGGGASIDLSGSVSISGTNISTMPPVCKCTGGL